MMAKYNPLTPELVKELESIVGEKNVTVDPDKLETYSHDEETDPRYQHMPEAVYLAIWQPPQLGV